jgi:hypothetical protein
LLTETESLGPMPSVPFDPGVVERADEGLTLVSGGWYDVKRKRNLHAGMGNVVRLRRTLKDLDQAPLQLHDLSG